MTRTATNPREFPSDSANALTTRMREPDFPARRTKMRNTPPRIMLPAMRGSLATRGCFSNELANGNTSVFITRINRVRAERYILIQELAVGK